jgi:hypothetical protein
MSVAKYLSGLRWDGSERIDFVPTMLGADDTPRHRRYLRAEAKVAFDSGESWHVDGAEGYQARSEVPR